MGKIEELEAKVVAAKKEWDSLTDTYDGLEAGMDYYSAKYALLQAKLEALIKNWSACGETRRHGIKALQQILDSVEK